jgi:hypothetical protein
MQERDPPESRFPSGSGIQSIAAREDWMKPSRRAARRGLKLTLEVSPDEWCTAKPSRRSWNWRAALRRDAPPQSHVN